MMTLQDCCAKALFIVCKHLLYDGVHFAAIMSFQIAYCGSESFGIEEEKEHGENKDNNIHTGLQNNTEDAKISEGAKSFATEVTPKWLSFSFKLHDFVNTNYNRYIEDFTHDDVENKIKSRSNCAFVVKQVANEHKSSISPINCGNTQTDPKKTEMDTVALNEGQTETKDAFVKPPVKMSGFLSSVVQPLTADANIANDENATTVEQVQPEGCFCWPLVHLIYRIRYRLFDKKKDKEIQKIQKIKD
ncbi:Hypothetical predicted protein [Mytilus galloprovincialis]|uniref:Uncharacterized protein n=1 Tax=Mytilus galloprovincialis TaxID=29158 RepID=A0A8B6BLH1_MYTGA|nr:Hypothetical predicted protein [Mytilus galloprovincialis]